MRKHLTLMNLSIFAEHRVNVFQEGDSFRRKSANGFHVGVAISKRVFPVRKGNPWRKDVGNETTVDSCGIPATHAASQLNRR